VTFTQYPLRFGFWVVICPQTSPCPLELSLSGFSRLQLKEPHSLRPVLPIDSGFSPLLFVRHTQCVFLTSHSTSGPLNNAFWLNFLGCGLFSPPFCVVVLTQGCPVLLLTRYDTGTQFISLVLTNPYVPSMSQRYCPNGRFQFYPLFQTFVFLSDVKAHCTFHCPS